MSLKTVVAAAYLVTTLSARRKRKRKTRWWRRKLFVICETVWSDFYHKLVADDEALFQNFTRMSKEDFECECEKNAACRMLPQWNCVLRLIVQPSSS